jgi:hypothetical protein
MSEIITKNEQKNAMIKNYLTRFVILIILVGLLLFPNGKYTKADQECTGKVCLSWAFGALVGVKNNRKLIKITRDTELKSGDQLKMLVKLNKKCFVYVFYYSSQGQLYILLPYNLNQFPTDYETSKNYYIPQGNLVLELDENIGKEKIYLIASARRLHELENLFGSYNSAEGLKKPEFIENIIQEIRHLRKRHKKFTAEAERPVASTGSVRAPIISEKASLPDLNKITVEITANDFFAKTYTIDHK